MAFRPCHPKEVRDVERDEGVLVQCRAISLARLAADLTCTTPNLKGLPLLRAAMEALPVDRHRPVIALSQAPWFVGMVQDELRRRRAVALREACLGATFGLEDDPGSRSPSRVSDRAASIPVKEIRERQMDVIGVLEGSRATVPQESRHPLPGVAATMVPLLKNLIGEVRTLNERLGQPPRPSIIATRPAGLSAGLDASDPGTGDSPSRSEVAHSNQHGKEVTCSSPV